MTSSPTSASLTQPRPAHFRPHAAQERPRTRRWRPAGIQRRMRRRKCTHLGLSRPPDPRLRWPQRDKFSTEAASRARSAVYSVHQHASLSSPHRLSGRSHSLPAPVYPPRIPGPTAAVQPAELRKPPSPVLRSLTYGHPNGLGWASKGSVHPCLLVPRKPRQRPRSFIFMANCTWKPPAPRKAMGYYSYAHYNIFLFLVRPYGPRKYRKTMTGDVKLMPWF